MAKRWLKKASPRTEADQRSLEGEVRSIIVRVREEGDAALRDYTRQFDKVAIEQFRVSDAEIRAAGHSLSEDLLSDMEFGIERIRAFAEGQLLTFTDLEAEVLPGVHLGHRIIPVASVGCYVPGGRSPLLSAAQMAVIPAKVAGVSRVVVCTPPSPGGRIHPAALWGAHRAGADEIYCVGGAQAIAALAYGTESIRPVDQIVGPGSRFVTEAKRQVVGKVGIDLLGGPSEVAVIADDTARPDWVAADLLAQAEHDADARAILITISRRVADQTLQEIDLQLEKLSTPAVARQSWHHNGEVVLVDTLDEAIAVSDEVAPAHLEVHATDPRTCLGRLKNYGSLYLGEETAVVFSDKVIGTNHILPTFGAARYTGGLWVGTFMKTLTHQWLTQAGAERIAPYCVRQSEREGLECHRHSAALRLGGRW